MCPIYKSNRCVPSVSQVNVSHLWVKSVLLCAFLCSSRVVVSMGQCCFQCWQVLFLPPFLIHIVCQRHLWDVMTYAWSLVFLFFGPHYYFYWFKRVTWNHITEYNLFAFDRKTWNHITVRKLIVFDRNTWNHIRGPSISFQNFLYRYLELS